jgi:hypothetical protein
VENPEANGQPASMVGRGEHAKSLVADAFERAGWRVERRGPRSARLSPDLRVSRRGIAYAVEIKAGPEGRPDRLVPLFAQAVIESRRVAGRSAAPLAVVAAPRIAPRAAAQIVRFADDYAPDAALGVIDFEGLRVFRGPQLEDLNAEPVHRPFARAGRPRPSAPLFSDLNQWMLKVLLAPEIPENLLSAPRGRYRNASELARAARVSVMSAFRFVQQLGLHGYLHESAPFLRLVRRADLLERWQASAQRSGKELPVRFVLPGGARAQLRKMLGGDRACLALFAAADALKLGFVEGLPPYVYVQRLGRASVSDWKGLRLCEPGEVPGLILRAAPAPQSVFRGIVRPEGLAACDVLQVWLDVASHPARGREQADLIRKRVIQGVVEGEA